MSGFDSNRLAKTFTALASKGHKALITYIMAGDPDLGSTAVLVKALVAGGADIIELGVPFSDPLADGPSIQRAGQRSLAAGTTLPAILAAVSALRKDTQVPIVIMSYYNPILRLGLEHFALEAAEAGIDGLIVPDLPLEESARLGQELEARGIFLVPLLAPTSTEARINQVAERRNGFVYCVSLTGVTGARTELPVGVGEFLERVRSTVQQPVGVGFGISTPEQAKKMARFADGVIIGSAIVNLIEQHGQEISRLEAEIKLFVGNLKASLL